MNLAERLAARYKAAKEADVQASRLRHEQRIAELGEIPFERILEIVEYEFEQHVWLSEVCIYANVSATNQYNPFKENINDHYKCCFIPKAWIEPVCDFLRDNGFNVSLDGWINITRIVVSLPA